MNKEAIAQVLAEALRKLCHDGLLPEDAALEPQDLAQRHIERSRDPTHGDFASNLALQLAKRLKHPPRELAEQLLKSLPEDSAIDRAELAGPGFLNFFLSREAEAGLVEKILKLGEDYGRNNTHRGEKAQLEFVSANPTGPLHVGHGRGAAYGDSAARLLEANGYEIEREYYVNDAGRQMDILALSIWLRYLQIDSNSVEFPDNAYQGEYISTLAGDWHKHHGARWRKDVHAELADAVAMDDQEKRLDQMISIARQTLGKEEFSALRDMTCERIIDDIRGDLLDFRVEFNHWFSERSLQPARIEETLQRLEDSGHTEQRDGALWFLSTRFGDDRDRVLRRANGITTYFAADIAYHVDKFERGYRRMINIWGADHHGYMRRLKAAMKALNFQSERLDIHLVQLVHLRRGEEQLSMSTRQGEFVSLRELREEVGVDAARFFYVMRRIDVAADFDLQLAVTQNKDNPVYYVQYAHARVCSLFEQLKARDIHWDTRQQRLGLASTHLLKAAEEKALIKRLGHWPEIVAQAGERLEPHRIATELRELAAEFHICYNKHRYLDADEDLRNARLCLALALKQVIANGLDLLGVSAPERM